eukprot:1035721-Alexandrium_andersonii.AAC.1
MLVACQGVARVRECGRDSCFGPKLVEATPRPGPRRNNGRTRAVRPLESGKANRHRGALVLNVPALEGIGRALQHWLA